MRLNLEKPIVFFDLETTSTDAKTARIVSISLIKLHPDGNREKVKTLVNPGVPIPADAAAIHGITDEMVAGKHTFKQLAPSILKIVKDQMLGGFNLLAYDIPVLSMEFDRVSVTWPEATEKLEVIDVGNIFKKMHPRTLSAAFKLYTGADLEEAHDAEVDNDATIDVFLAQLDTHPELSSDPSELAEFSKFFTNTVDLAGTIVLDADGDYLYNIGGKKGTKVKDDKGSFAGWMLDKDFTANTKAHLRRIINELSN